MSDSISFVSSLDQNNGYTTSSEVNFIQSMNNIHHASLSTHESNYSSSDYLNEYNNSNQNLFLGTTDVVYAKKLRGDNMVERCYAGAKKSHDDFVNKGIYSNTLSNNNFEVDRASGAIISGCIGAVIADLKDNDTSTSSGHTLFYE